MKIRLKTNAKDTIPKYSEIENLLKNAMSNPILSKLNEVDFNQIRDILGDSKIPDGHIHQVALDLGLDVIVEW